MNQGTRSGQRLPQPRCLASGCHLSRRALSLADGLAVGRGGGRVDGWRDRPGANAEASLSTCRLATAPRGVPVPCQ